MGESGKRIAAGELHSLAITLDGKVWTWGRNVYGQLGSGTSSIEPSQDPRELRELSGITSVAAGFEHSLALKQDGTVFAWGSNYFGQVGDIESTLRPAPVQGLEVVVAIAAGGETSLAVLHDGSVFVWGFQAHAQTGLRTPARMDGISDVVAIAAGNDHVVAVKRDGTAWSWGNNSEGQLGDGTTRASGRPVIVKGLSGVIQVACGWKRSLALDSTGQLWAWGDTMSSGSRTPVRNPNLADILDIGAGRSQFVAVTKQGIVYTWRQIGSGSGTERPNQVPTEAIGVSAGRDHSLALQADGRVLAWGSNVSGQLGVRSVANSAVPVTVLPPPPPAGSVVQGVPSQEGQGIIGPGVSVVYDLAAARLQELGKDRDQLATQAGFLLAAQAAVAAILMAPVDLIVQLRWVAGVVLFLSFFFVVISMAFAGLRSLDPGQLDRFVGHDIDVVRDAASQLMKKAIGTNQLQLDAQRTWITVATLWLAAAVAVALLARIFVIGAPQSGIG
jgi:alpha-tubulin suppressor-like RCC1 family protein